MTFDEYTSSRTVRLDTGMEMTFACRPLPNGQLYGHQGQQRGTGTISPSGSTATPPTSTAKNTCVP